MVSPFLEKYRYTVEYRLRMMPAYVLPVFVHLVENNAFCLAVTTMRRFIRLISDTVVFWSLDSTDNWLFCGQRFFVPDGWDRRRGVEFLMAAAGLHIGWPFRPYRSMGI